MMITEGQFESYAKSVKRSSKVWKELEKIGLFYNGGDPVYNDGVQTFVDFVVRKGSLLDKELKKYSSNLSSDYNLVYSFRAKKFFIENYINDKSKGKVPLNTEFNSTELGKKIIEFYTEVKQATTYAIGNQKYQSVRKYADTHLHEEFKCFNY